MTRKFALARMLGRDSRPRATVAASRWWSRRKDRMKYDRMDIGHLQLLISRSNCSKSKRERSVVQSFVAIMEKQGEVETGRGVGLVGCCKILRG